MPTVLSVTMAVGARLLAKKEAIVTRLSAIEELAGVDVLCSDKTGTLTQNKLTLGDPFTVDSIAPDKVILWAALASRAEDKDTIDLAVIGGVKDDKELKSLQGASLSCPSIRCTNARKPPSKVRTGNSSLWPRERRRSFCRWRPMPAKSSQR
jgi:magnesium-transporting ATPase (P-type)